MCTQIAATVQHHRTGVEAFLCELDPYIRIQARKQILNAGKLVHPDALDMEIEELAQQTRIKVWQACQKQCITNPKAYISRIAHNELISMARRHRPASPLPLDDDGELYQGNVIYSLVQESQDPANVVELAETNHYHLRRAIDAISALPQRQQRAMLCFLKERIDDLHAFVHECHAHNIDVDTLHSPKGGGELQAMRASNTIARKKLREQLSVTAS